MMLTNGVVIEVAELCSYWMAGLYCQRHHLRQSDDPVRTRRRSQDICGRPGRR
jgi:hypothetical protein